MDNELDAVLQSSATQLEYDARRAEVEARLERAAAGELARPGEITPIYLDPEIWEIRWNFDGDLLRLYVGEPAQHPLLLVALHYHWKSLAGNYAQIKAAQDDQIKVAVSRFGRWLTDPAGHS